MNSKLVRITTVPLSLEKLLEGQLSFMQKYFEVTAISNNPKQLYKLGENENFKTYPVEMTRSITPIKDIVAVYKLYRFLKKEKPIIVHTHTPKAGMVGMLASKLARVPLRLHTVAGLPLLETSGFKRQILNLVEKLTYFCATKIYPNSKGLKEIILEQNFTIEKKLKIIGNGSSNGIDTSYFNPVLFLKKDKQCLRSQYNITESDFVLLFVGRLVKDKGINELVEAFKILQLEPKNKFLKLLLVGPFETDLDPLAPQTIQEIQNNPNIISTGYQKDVRLYFAISDLLVFPSYREGFPNVVMQAGAMGLPSIVSDINGCNEIVRDRANGLIIPPKDVEALQKAMKQILEDKKLYSHLQNNARPLIVSRYQREDIWQALLNEYKYLLEEKNIPFSN